MQTNRAARQEVAQLEAAAIHATQAGKEDEGARLWARLLEFDPVHVRALSSLGKRAFKYGDLATARTAFDRLVAADPAGLQGWVNLALVCQGLKDEAGEAAALHGALRADPTDLVALILRANLLERQGDTHKAASVYGAAASVSPPLEQLSPELRPAVSHALAYRSQYQTKYSHFLDDYLAPHFAELDGEALHRFRDALDIMTGRKRRYESQSMMLHYPGLLPQPFFDRADFPWLDAIEAGTDNIRDEFLKVLQAEQGFTPYLTYPDDVPHNQFAELNNSPRWSAFHLLKDGVAVPEHAAQCPQTMALLGGAPQPDQPGRTPTAMFSLLKPNTHIPPHTGVSNARLVTHLPLIVPPDCGFRVGNETRSWVPGQAWVFDDTIEHEAWNRSAQLRVVLIFDIWHPQLSAAERRMITAMTAGINEFRGGSGEFDL
ncbi:aspartyl/asparaginyl beta-hydroxylase domain-containing protein [Rugamonas sp.]|uniref:aspartyl/asparaginyl beta-hydroxylase domain-containing protein n=1 Tax=Rugamonas sp. TaxID=1926287 RepID=UPI0025D467FF|nr:aspartyl/asparaginyl beta-hydroxylase domain-containing protein [Rugamonas sp.]